MEQFIPFFQGDSNQLTPQGQQLMELAGKYGSLTNVIPTPLSERKPGLAGHMRFDDVQNVRVDPTQGGLHTAAHEIFHSAFPTAVGDAYRKKAMIGIENPMTGHMMHMKDIWIDQLLMVQNADRCPCLRQFIISFDLIE